MTPLFATLDDLTTPVTTVSGRSCGSIAIYRLTLGQASPIFATSDPLKRVALFCAAAVLSSEEPCEAIRADTLDAADAAEVVSALVEMAAPEDEMSFEGNGVSHPLVYTLAHPVTLAEDMVVTTFEFKARTLGEVAGFLNAEGEVASFREFMRAFATVIGVPMPVTDTLVNALDIRDYTNIKEHVMGKLVKSRGRLKKAS